MKVGDRVCMWMDCAGEQRLGTLGRIYNIDKGSGVISVEYEFLKERYSRDFTEGEARTNLSELL